MAQSKTKAAILLSFSQNLNLVLSIVSSAILSRLFSQTDLGIYKQTMMVFELVAPFLLLSIPEALYFYLPKGDCNKTIFNTFCLVTFAGAITFCCLFFGRFFFANQFNDPDLVITLKVYALFALFYFPIQIASPIFIVMEKAGLMAIWAVLTNFAMIMTVIISTIITGNYYVVLIARVIVELIVCLVSLFIILKLTKTKREELKIDFSMIKKILKYALPLGLTTLIGTLCVRLDKMVVSMFVTPDEFAVYNNGAMEIPFINTIVGSISAVIIVEYVALYDKKDFNRIVELFRTCAYKTSLFLFPVMVYFLFWNKEFIVTLYSEKYLNSSIPFFVYLFTIPVRIVQYGPVIQAMNKNYLLVVRSVCDLIVNLICNFIFVHLFGMIGAALATIAVLYIWHVPFNLFVISKGLHTNVIKLFPIRKLIFVFMTSLVIVITSLFFKKIEMMPLIKLMVTTIYCVIIYLPILYFYDKETFLSLIRIFRRAK